MPDYSSPLGGPPLYPNGTPVNPFDVSATTPSPYVPIAGSSLYEQSQGLLRLVEAGSVVDGERLTAAYGRSWETNYFIPARVRGILLEGGSVGPADLNLIRGVPGAGVGTGAALPEAAGTLESLFPRAFRAAGPWVRRAGSGTASAAAFAERYVVPIAVVEQLFEFQAHIARYSSATPGGGHGYQHPSLLNVRILPSAASQVPDYSRIVEDQQRRNMLGRP